MPETRRPTTLLIDTASLVYRAYYSTPASVTAPDGTPVNAAHGFMGMLARLVADRRPARLCCALDDDWRPEWRVELIDSYKTYRAEPGSVQEQAEDELAPQSEVLFELLDALGIPLVGHPGYEAEDVIGTLAEREEAEVAIVSGDRDLFQLVRDPDVYVLFPRRGVSEMDRVDESYIAQRYGIPGRAYRDFAVLRGDPSDGLPGVRGVGEKLAAALITRYGSIEGVLGAIDAGEQSVALNKVRRDTDYVRRAVKVVTIPTDLPIPKVDLTRPQPAVDDGTRALAEEWGLAGALRRLEEALAAR